MQSKKEHEAAQAQHVLHASYGHPTVHEIYSKCHAVLYKKNRVVGLGLAILF